MRYRHDGFHSPRAAARTGAAAALLAVCVLLALAATASAEPGAAGAAGPPSGAQIRAFQRAHGPQADGGGGPGTLFSLRAGPRGPPRGAAWPAGGPAAAAGRPAPPSGQRGGIGSLLMFVAGLAILAALGVWKLREPFLYRVRMLRDSLGGPGDYAPPGVRWQSGDMFAE